VGGEGYLLDIEGFLSYRKGGGKEGEEKTGEDNLFKREGGSFSYRQGKEESGKRAHHFSREIEKKLFFPNQGEGGREGRLIGKGLIFLGERRKKKGIHFLSLLRKEEIFPRRGKKRKRREERRLLTFFRGGEKGRNTESRHRDGEKGKTMLSFREGGNGKGGRKDSPSGKGKEEGKKGRNFHHRRGKGHGKKHEPP